MKKTLKYLAVATLPVIASSAFALETVNSTATVVVQNAFTLTESAAMTFGTIRATADTAATATASLTLPADGSAGAVTAGTPASANIVIITAGTPASFAVSNAAPSTALTLTLPASAVSLTTAGGTANFTVDTFVAQITSGPSNGSAYAASNLITDAAGAVTFDVGATLHTDATTPASDYLDGTYTGNYTVQVDY